MTHGRGEDRPDGLRRAARWLPAVVGLGLLVLVLAPAHPVAAWLARLPVVAHAMAFARLTGAGLAAMALLMLVVALAGRRRRPAAAVAALVLLASGAVLVANPGGGPWGRPPTPPADGGQRLVVVALNSQGTLDAATLGALVAEHHPDVLLLPELDAMAAADAARGLPYHAHAAPDEGFSPGYAGEIPPTSVLIADALDGLKAVPVVGPPTAFGTVAVRVPSGVDVVAVHPAPPLPGLIGRWGRDTAAVADFLAAAPDHPVVLGGDLNATLRHGLLRDGSPYRDAAAGCGWAQGTWPASVPAWAATPIDHVFVSEHLTPVGCQLLEVPGADHRAVVVTLDLAR